MTTRITPDDILTDDRLAAMHSAVMTEVGDDLQARRRRRRHRTMGIAAAAAVAVVAVGGGVVATQLQSSTSESSPSYASAPQTGGRGAAESAPITGAAPMVAPAPKTAPTTAPNAPSTPMTAPTNRQVITTGTVEVTNADPASVATELAATAERLGGRVDARTETGGEKARATLTLRVPNEKVNELVEKVGGLGEVGSVRLEHEDVTGTVVDLEARIRATQVSVDRLTAILARADTTDQVIAAESALTSRQQELETLQSRRASIEDQVSLSTVTVTVEKPTVTVDRSGFTGGLRDGWDALLGAGRWLLVIVGAVLPWAAVLLVLYGVYRAVRRFRRRS
ncbi:Uncharacterised protein (plasmid) [Tsukamurella tyrosinosolvens]|uniref:DUF4349 domain-containing protein n=1 Tax=Tsukamurella tyrosinosolvens TaxID=57704 RepID=A0A1H4PKX3_TSUTY|nr:DUF4349 domain-containing protein [Tsukamurella tyrosinosolvens]KXO97382.1 hypothetical protein AXK58_09210 [Tsukamurella tyrosinosolvens]SEC07970.1 protein of unknown function [Tsukamurella tyrosinosolvens]VEH97143.1 Uncharacterised protein [Tsukamurella tyrosinosolvens]